MKISNVRFADYNGQDNLYFDVDINLRELMKESPMYENCKILYEGTKDEGKLWVKIWKCGIARFGFTKKSDPLHGNEEYTWSSNATCINEEFNLLGTPLELSRYGAGIKEEKDNGCYWAGEILKSLALKIGEDNEDKLHWGLEQWRLTIDTTAPYVDGRDK